MNKKIIIGILITILIIVVIVVIIKNNKGNENSAITIQTQIMSEIEEKLKQAIDISKENYIKYGKQNFSVYFGIDFLNENFVDGRISLVTNLENNTLDDNVKIYSPYGEKLEEFPTLNYEKDNYKIEEGKTYLIKVYSYTNANTFYYTVQIDKNGNSNLQQICYIDGEIDNIEENI